MILSRCCILFPTLLSQGHFWHKPVSPHACGRDLHMSGQGCWKACTGRELTTPDHRRPQDGKINLFAYPGAPSGALSWEIQYFCSCRDRGHKSLRGWRKGGGSEKTLSPHTLCCDPQEQPPKNLQRSGEIGKR